MISIISGSTCSGGSTKQCENFDSSHGRSLPTHYRPALPQRLTSNLNMILIKPRVNVTSHTSRWLLNTSHSCRNFVPSRTKPSATCVDWPACTPNIIRSVRDWHPIHSKNARSRIREWIQDEVVFRLGSTDAYRTFLCWYSWNRCVGIPCCR